MDITPPDTAAWRPTTRIALSPTATVLLAIAFGLCGGYLDLSIMLFKKLCWNEEGYFRNARDFPWSVPVGHAVLLLVPGAVVAATTWLRRKPVSLRATSWLFATLAIWGALLRMPMYGACSVLLAGGLGRLTSDAVAAHGLRPRLVRGSLAAIFGLLCVLAALSSGLQAVREYRALAGLPPTSPGARNVILIVWDTVRAYNTSVHHYTRGTTPNLARCATKGVTYQLALAPAPWTYPSHSSFFTGQWPYRINSQWKFTLDASEPTLAEHLASRGYQTAGFVANTNCCSYESGLARGFAHYEDYTLTPRSLLTRTVPGNWIGKNLLFLGNFYDRKWIGLQSRGAGEINDAFLGWLSRRRPDRPFFAFLNYFDAHEPYVPPRGYEGRFGIPPKTPTDYLFLFDFVGLPKKTLLKRYLFMARDCYDACIAFLDEELGRLLNQLQAEGLLDNTDVIITSDHGEAFGDHGKMGHGNTVNLDEIGVPLVILSQSAPAGRVVESAVSLRDLPATVVDLLGLSAGSPFPGRSLAAYWALPSGTATADLTSPAVSEQADETVIHARSQFDPAHPAFQMSLVAMGKHYIRDGIGKETLYDSIDDPFEHSDLMGSKQGQKVVEDCRRMLLKVLSENPGSAEVEQAYLESYRRRLRALVEDSSAPRVAIGR
jgi:arylsulfatase A-like enzyme